MNKPKPKIGDVLFRKGDGNMRHVDLHEVTVTRVGRKFFTVSDGKKWSESRHFLGTWKQENGGYSADYFLHPSREEFAAIQLRWGRQEQLARSFGYPSDWSCVPDDVLSRVVELLEPYHRA